MLCSLAGVYRKYVPSELYPVTIHLVEYIFCDKFLHLINWFFPEHECRGACVSTAFGANALVYCQVNGEGGTLLDHSLFYATIAKTPLQEQDEVHFRGVHSFPIRARFRKSRLRNVKLRKGEVVVVGDVDDKYSALECLGTTPDFWNNTPKKERFGSSFACWRDHVLVSGSCLFLLDSTRSSLQKIQLNENWYVESLRVVKDELYLCIDVFDPRHSLYVVADLTKLDCNTTHLTAIVEKKEFKRADLQDALLMPPFMIYVHYTCVMVYLDCDLICTLTMDEKSLDKWRAVEGHVTTNRLWIVAKHLLAALHVCNYDCHQPMRKEFFVSKPILEFTWPKQENAVSHKTS